MNKTDVSFVIDIIDGYIRDMDEDIKNPTYDIRQEEVIFKRGGIDALKSLKSTLKHFVKEANKL